MRSPARGVALLLHEQAFGTEELGPLVRDRIPSERARFAQQLERDLGPARRLRSLATFTMA